LRNGDFGSDDCAYSFRAWAAGAKKANRPLHSPLPKVSSGGVCGADDPGLFKYDRDVPEISDEFPVYRGCGAGSLYSPSAKRSQQADLCEYLTGQKLFFFRKKIEAPEKRVRYYDINQGKGGKEKWQRKWHLT